MKTSLIFLFIISFRLHAQMIIPLYEGNIPNSRSSDNEETTEQQHGITIISKISIPVLTVFLPPAGKANGTGIVICPGGGYQVNAHSHEGIDVARRFAEIGTAAFVLKYRIPSDVTMVDREVGPLQDAQQALKIVRERSREWNLDPNRIGIMGFSAGGHLASTAGTHFEKVVIDNPRKTSVRPDFMILIYPVISFRDSVGHIGSREQLIGKNPSVEKTRYYSNELRVNEQTPPSFLVHASDDDVVKPENSVLFYQALVRHKVKAELHIYQGGGHGFGMTNPSSKDSWMERCANWLDANGWMRR